MNRDQRRRSLWLQAILLLAGTFFVYWPSLRGGYIWDDLVLVKSNLLITGQQNIWSVWFQSDFPLTLITTAIERLVFGDNPTGYRVVNALLHGSSAILLWRVLISLKVPGAWLAAALFAVHPVGVASVAWISELKNTLSLPFYLLSFWCYLQFEAASSRGGIGQSRLCYGVSLICFLGALATKTSTAMLPVVLLLCAWWQRGRITRLDALRLAPHFALALIFSLMTIWFQNHGAIQGVTVQTEGLAGRLAGAGMALGFYLSKALVPVNLSMIYPRWEIGENLFLSFVPLLVLVLVVAGCWRYRKSWGRPALMGLGCFGVSLFPVLGFFDMYFMIFSRVSDHLAYLPLMVVTAALASGITLIRAQTISRAAGLALILGLAFLTWQRAHVFASDEALWRDTVAKNPQSWNAHNNLACNLAEKGELDPAMKHFAISLQLNPRNASAQRNYAKALVIKGEFPEAERHFRAALEQKPGDAETLTAYAEALAAHGRLEEAIARYRAALHRQPASRTRLQLAPLLAVTGCPGEAITEFRLVLQETPDSVEALNNLAWILATGSDAAIRDGAEAVNCAERARELSGGNDATILGTLAAAYAEAGEYPKAITASQQALTMAQTVGNTGLVRMNQQLQQLYRAGRAYHEQAGTPSTNAPASRRR